MYAVSAPTLQPALLADPCADTFASLSGTEGSIGPWRACGERSESIHAPIVRRPNSFYRRRDQYPVDWPRLSAAIKELCGYQCMDCGKQCRRPGEPFDTVRRTLTIAHLWPADHAPDADIVVVGCLCAPCHLRYDCDRKAYARRWGQPGRMVYGVVQLAFPYLDAIMLS